MKGICLMIKDYKLYLGDNVEVMKKEIEDHYFATL